MEQQASHAREYVVIVEGEFQRIRDGIPALMDENLLPSASTGESKELYQIHVDRIAQKTSEIPKLQSVDVPVVLVTQFPRVQVVEEAVEIPQFQVVKKIGVIPDTIRVETTEVEVEKIRSEFFEAERALVASPFSKVKSLISDRTLKTTEKKENLESDVANMKFDAGAFEDPFVKVKGLITRLIDRL